jgi:hypothetical protein
MTTRSIRPTFSPDDVRTSAFSLNCMIFDLLSPASFAARPIASKSIGIIGIIVNPLTTSITGRIEQTADYIDRLNPVFKGGYYRILIENIYRCRPAGSGCQTIQKYEDGRS